MAFIPYFREKISRIVKNSHEFPSNRTRFILAFGVFLTDLCSTSEYIIVNREGILAIFVRFKQNATDPPNSRNAIVSVSLQYRKTSRMNTKYTKFQES